MFSFVNVNNFIKISLVEECQIPRANSIQRDSRQSKTMVCSGPRINDSLWLFCIPHM